MGTHTATVTVYKALFDFGTFETTLIGIAHAEPVTLIVADNMDLSKSSISATLPQGDTKTEIFTITNPGPGEGTVRYNVSGSTNAWQSVGTSGCGFVAAGNSCTGNTDFYTNNVSPGSYSGEINITAGTVSKTMPVLLTVINAQCTDNDGDGYYGYHLQNCQEGKDCKDDDNLTYPGATETCADGIDNNCDGQIDEGCALDQNLGSGKNKTNPATEDCFSIANFSTGNLYEEYTIPLRFLNLTLSYNSRDSYTGPLGTSWTHRYNTNLSNINVTSLVLTQQDGRRVRYQSTDGVTYLPEEKFGETSTISMNPDNTFTLAETNGIIKNFAIDGKLTAIADKNKNTITLTYTGRDLTTITGPYGRVVTFTYTSGKITTITDPISRQYSITYTGNLLTSITNPASETTIYTYNINQTLESIEDPSGGITTYIYDPQGRLLSSQDPLPLSYTKTIQYIDTEYKAIITDRNGNTTEYIYDKSLNVKKQKKIR